MKKALFLTALLAGTAMAETMTEDGRVIYESVVTYGTDNFAEITTRHGGELIHVGKPEFTCKDLVTGGDVDFVGNTHTMITDMGANGNGFVLTLDFPVNASYDEYTISNISLLPGLNHDDGLPYDSLASYEGENDGNAPTIHWGYKVIQNGEVKKEDSMEYTYLFTGANHFSTGFDLVNDQIELVGSFSLEITVKNPDIEQSPFYVSIDSVTVQGKAPENYQIPEPATATLSLLALAGLAARRRRK